MKVGFKYYTVKEKLVNIIGFTFPIVIFLILVGSLLKSVQRAKNADILIQKTAEKLEKAKEEEKELQEKVRITQSEAYLEEQLRNKLGLAKEGEIVLVLPPDDELRKLAPSLANQEVFEPKPNWQKWVDLFI